MTRPSQSAPAWSRKGHVILLMVLGAGLVFAATTQTWLTVALPEQAVATSGLAIAGSEAATPVTALALVALAGAFAASIAGTVARYIVAVLVLAASAGIVLFSLAVAADPERAASGAIAAAIGIIGSSATVEVTLFPAVAAAAGGLLAVSAVLLPVAGRYWSRSRRFDNDAVPAQDSAVREGPEAEGAMAEAAEAVGGEAQIPAGRSTGSAVRAGAHSAPRAQAPSEPPVDEIDSWDQLSRGKDPTS